MIHPRPEMHHHHTDKHHHPGNPHHEAVHLGPEAINSEMGMHCDMNVPGAHPEPVVHCPVEKVCCRHIHHQIKHVQPVHTRIINKHIYHHCSMPHFTCSEENVCCHVWDPCCKPHV